MSVHRIDKFPIHLGRHATATVEPEFTGTMDWYMGYVARHEADGLEGRLVSLFTFDRPWDGWEMHPNGSEVVLCTAGRITLHQEHADGSRNIVTLEPGEYAINPPGTWHTADIDGEATAVFITAGGWNSKSSADGLRAPVSHESHVRARSTGRADHHVAR